MELTAYEILDVTGTKRTPVAGLVVGRFAVRAGAVDGVAQAHDPTGLVLELDGKHAVDHLPSGYLIAWLNDAADALIVADDLSRFALEDVSGETPDEVVRQLGPDVVEWLAAVMRAPRAFGFRVWFARRGIERPIEGRACNAAVDVSAVRF